MELVINVTQEHINRGSSSTTHCPIALAIRDIVGILPVVEVQEGSVCIGENASGIVPGEYPTTEEMDDFINDFDEACEGVDGATPSVFRFAVKSDKERPSDG